MKKLLPAILLIFVSIDNHAYCQLWKLYSDSAKVYRDQRNTDKAIEFYTKAKKELEKDSLWSNTYARICNSLANLYDDMGQYAEAELLFMEAKQVREKVLGKENSDYASSCNNLAVLYANTGQYEKAELLFKEAKQVREKVLGKENSAYALACDNLANVYLETGQYEKAEPLYLEAKEIMEKVLGKERPEYAQTSNNLGRLYMFMGEFEKAEQFYLEAKRIFEKAVGKEDPLYATSCNNLAILYTYMRKYIKIEPLFLEAKEIWGKKLSKEHPTYAISCNNLANLYKDMGQYEKAEPLYLEAKQIREKVLGTEHPRYATSCNNLAELYWNMGQYEKAEPLYLEAKQVFEKAVGKGHPLYATNCHSLARLYWNLKKPEKADTLYAETYYLQSDQINKIFQFTSEAEKLSYLKTIADLDNDLLSFKTSVYPQSNQGFSFDVSLSSRNLILSSAQQLRQAIHMTTDTSIKNRYNTWISLREQLSFWYVKPLSNRPEYVKDLEEQANTLEKELTRLSSTFKKEQERKNITWKKIQQNLKPNEAAIEFVKFNFYNGKRFTDSTYYVAVLVTKDKPEPKLISLFEEKQLKSYKTITSLYGPDQKVSAYNLIWKPIEKHLKGITNIYFAPAGLLYRISFHALPINDHQVLSDKYQLKQLNTTASVARQSEHFIDTSDKIYLYGGIQYDVDSTTLKQAVVAYRSNKENTHFLADDGARGNSWQYLPGSEKEIREIEGLGKQKKYAVVSAGGVRASEESIKALNGNPSPSILHIATHGFFFPDPKESKKDSIKNSLGSGSIFRQSDNPLFRSGLLLAGANNAWQGKQIEGIEDGILTAYEVSNLYLPNSKLVVLSACETGLGDIQGNEGVYGLQRAFKMAGVENLIMSLWKVPDNETAEFMQQFYKNIFSGQSINDAFSQAQTVMRNKYRKEPYKWAAWILVR